MKADFNDAAAVRYGGQDIVEIRATGNVLWRADLEGALLASAADPDPAGNVLVMHNPPSSLVGYNAGTGAFTSSENARAWADGDLSPSGGPTVGDYFDLGNQQGARLTFDQTLDIGGATLVVGVLPGDLANSKVYLWSSGNADRFVLAPNSFEYRAGGGTTFTDSVAFDPWAWAVLTIRATASGISIYMNGAQVINNPDPTPSWLFRHFGWHQPSAHYPVAGILGPIILQDKADGSRSDLVPVAQAYIRGKVSQVP